MEHDEGKQAVNNGIKFLLEMTLVEKTDEQQQTTTVYRGNPVHILPTQNIAFGGGLLGQALSAAVCSVPQGLYAHSLHNYFLNAGHGGCVDYHVKNVRNGTTSCNRFVQGLQNGKNIVNMQVSFKREDESSNPFEHQHVMPDCKGPEELISALEIIKPKLREDDSEYIKNMLIVCQRTNILMEYRPLDPETVFRSKPLPPKILAWMKIIEKFDDDENLHRCGLAFLSDCMMIETTLLPNDRRLQQFFPTSINHSIWFHNKFRVDEWLLYEAESCHTSGGIGFATGRFWTKKGLLVASVAQQAILRSLL